MTRQRWIILGAALVGVILLISEHSTNNSGSGGGTSGSPSSSPSSSAGARPCTVTVIADSLNVRSSPDGNAPVLGTYDKGAVVSADRTTRNGFRQLGPDSWAAEDFLDPTPDSDCG